MVHALSNMRKGNEAREVRKLKACGSECVVRRVSESLLYKCSTVGK